MSDISISYSRKDKAFVQQLHAALASEVCHEEINHAAAHNKRLVPIVF